MNRFTSVFAFVSWLVASVASAQVSINPGQNIQQVVNQHPAGTTFTLKSGVHRMQTITPRSGDTFVGDGQAVLNGSRILSSWTPSGSRWFATGQTQENMVITDQLACAPNYPLCNRPEDVWIDNVQLRHVGSLAEVVSGTFWFDYAQALFRSCS
jgi:hypothetical protein